MKKQLFQNKLIVKRSPTHGYGVFALKAIKKGELIEECYMIITPGGDDILEDYYFEVTKTKFAMLTGYGCIYNHNDDPNADYILNKKNRVMTFKALKNIPKGNEIFVSYGEDWFRDRSLNSKFMPKRKKKR